MMNKLKVVIGVLLTLGMVFKPIQVTPTVSITLVILGIVGALMVLDGLMKIEI